MSMDKEIDEYPITFAWFKKKKRTTKEQKTNTKTIQTHSNLKILFQIILLGIPWSGNFQKNPSWINLGGNY